MTAMRPFPKTPRATCRHTKPYLPWPGPTSLRSMAGWCEAWRPPAHPSFRPGRRTVKQRRAHMELETSMRFMPFRSEHLLFEGTRKTEVKQKTTNPVGFQTLHQLSTQRHFFLLRNPTNSSLSLLKAFVFNHNLCENFGTLF